AGIEALGHPGLEIARAMQLFVEPARFERLRIRAELVVRPAALERFACRLGGQHPRLDGAVAALDARGIEEAGVVADQRAAGKDELRQRLQPARGDGARAIADPLATLAEAADRRMGLEALELFVRCQIRIGVAQPDNEAHRNLAALNVTAERAAHGR